MLITMREKITGWIGWLLIGLICLAFSLFGLRYYLQRDARAFAAKVNDVEITVPDLDRAYQNVRQQMRAELGDNYDDEQLDENKIKSGTLEQLIDREVLVQAAQKAGFVTTDAMVAARLKSLPAFQEGGAFSIDQYENRLRLMGVSTAQFEADLRSDLLIYQLQSGASSTGIVLDSELNKIWSMQGQERKLEYLTIPWSNFNVDVNITEEEIELHYKKFPERYREHEQVKLEYLSLSAEALGADIVISKEEIDRLYEEDVDKSGHPEERRARHILVAVPEGADEAVVADARSKAEMIEKKLREGQAFADLARQFSDDPGSKDQGGDLGYFNKATMVAAFADVVFAQKVGEISAPIRTEFGFHIIELTDIRAAVAKKLDEIRDQLVADEKRRRGIDRMYEQLDTLASLAFENPDSLAKAAEGLGLPIENTDWFTRQGGTGIAAEPAVVDAAFSNDVLLDRNNSEPIELNGDRAIIVRVKEYREPNLRPLEAVRGEIEQTLRKEKAQLQARDQGIAVLKRLQDGESMETAATRFGYKLSSARFVGRNDGTTNAAIVRKAFQLPAPSADTVSYGDVELDSGDYALLRVSAIKAGDLGSLDAEQSKEFRRQYLKLYEIYQHQALMGDLRMKSKILLGGDSN